EMAAQADEHLKGDAEREVGDRYGEEQARIVVAKPQYIAELRAGKEKEQRERDAIDVEVGQRRPVGRLKPGAWQSGLNVRNRGRAHLSTVEAAVLLATIMLAAI